MPARTASRLHVLFSSFKDPVLEGSRLSDSSSRGETPFLTAWSCSIALVFLFQPTTRQPSHPAFSSRVQPFPQSALRRNYRGVFHPLKKGGNAHGECLGLSLQFLLEENKGGGNGLQRPYNNLNSQPLKGRESKRGILGGFPGTRFSRRGSPWLHTPVTMTIQPQPPVSMAAPCPIPLVFFLFSLGSALSPFSKLQECVRRGS